MQRVIERTLTGDNTNPQVSDPIVGNIIGDWSASVQLDSSGATTVYGIEYTLQRVWNMDGTSAVDNIQWEALEDSAGNAINSEGLYPISSPVAALRLTVNDTGTDTVTLRFLQTRDSR